MSRAGALCIHSPFIRHSRYRRVTSRAHSREHTCLRNIRNKNKRLKLLQNSLMEHPYYSRKLRATFQIQNLKNQVLYGNKYKQWTLSM